MNRKQLLLPIVAFLGYLIVTNPLIKRLYQGVVEPSPKQLKSPNPDLRTEFPDRSPEQIAVWLPNESLEALPAARTFSPVGLPFCVADDLGGALRHRIVFIPMNDQSIHLTQGEREELHRFVSDGGVLILQSYATALWPELTGLREVKPLRSRKRMRFNVGSDAGFAYLSEPELAEIPFASAETDDGMWSASVIPQKSTDVAVIAVYPDKSEPAMLRRAIGKGFVYTLGIELRDVIVRPQAGRSFDARRKPYNGFEPAADVFPLIFRGWYEHYTPLPLRLRSSPGESKALFLLSHTIGPGAHLKTAEDFSAIENQRGVRATYFIQTKYVLDKQDAPFYDASVYTLMAKLKRHGHEIASHGVSASPELDKFPLGTGVEKMRDYRPEVETYGKTYDGTLLGELHVSKTLLENKLPGDKVTGFRSRLFSYPALLDTALLRLGYQYDSSLRAPESMSHLPFHLTFRRFMTRESDIVELPMTFEDAGVDEAVVVGGPILETLRKIARYEGVLVWLLSPTEEGGKAHILGSVLDARPAGVKTMSLGEAARYWNTRSKVRFWTEPARSPNRSTLRLRLPAVDAGGISFEASRNIKSCLPGPGTGIKMRCSGKILTLEKTAGAREASVEIVWEQR